MNHTNNACTRHRPVSSSHPLTLKHTVNESHSLGKLLQLKKAITCDSMLSTWEMKGSVIYYIHNVITQYISVQYTQLQRTYVTFCNNLINAQ